MRGIVERSGTGVSQTAADARRITLLSWLLAITLTLAAEGAWALWLQNVWAAPSVDASPRTSLPMPPSKRAVPWAAEVER